MMRAALDRPILLALGVSGTVAAVAVLWSLAPIEIVNQADFPDTGRHYEVRVFDAFTVEADPQSRPDPDIVTGAILIALATAALIAAVVLRASGRPQRLRRFYTVTSVAFALLALDEFLAVHETIGYNLTALGDLPGVKRPDDVVFATFLIPAAAYLYAFRDILFSSLALRWLFGGALASFALAVACDLTGAWPEESLEVITGALVAIGFAILTPSHLSHCIVPAAGPGSSGRASDAPAAPGARPLERSAS